MHEPSCVTIVLIATLGILPLLCSDAASVHHGMQPLWAGRGSDGAPESLEPFSSLCVPQSECTRALSQPHIKSKDGAGHTSPKQVGQEETLMWYAEAPSSVSSDATSAEGFHPCKACTLLLVPAGSGPTCCVTWHACSLQTHHWHSRCTFS